LIIFQGQGGSIEYIPPRRVQAVPVAGLLKVVKTSEPLAVTEWRISRTQMARFGLRCLCAAVQRQPQTSSPSSRNPR
jgi:hypothetical protein